jgi:hypothetical protein
MTILINISNRLHVSHSSDYNLDWGGVAGQGWLSFDRLVGSERTGTIATSRNSERPSQLEIIDGTK